MLTADPFYSPENFSVQKPEFKKSSPKKEKKEKDPEAIETPSDALVDDLVSKIKLIDLSEYRINDLDLYRQTIQDTLSLCEEEIISPHISRSFNLKAVNDAVKFIKEKKCTGKILVDLKTSDDESEEKAKETDWFMLRRRTVHLAVNNVLLDKVSK